MTAADPHAPPSPPHPHRGTPTSTAGAPPEVARLGMILLHGRGATAAGILELAGELLHPELAFRAPQAAGSTWYPQRFLVPVEENEPFLSSALRRVGEEVDAFAAQGIAAERTILLGFSQGACLALEYAARHARRYGGLVAFSGALIGDPDLPRDDRGSLDGTPTYLGCSDRDPHIPRWRVDESTEILRRLGGEVVEEIYPGLGHTVNAAELQWVRSLTARLLASPPASPPLGA
jgi:predicted esterase